MERLLIIERLKFKQMKVTESNLGEIKSHFQKIAQFIGYDFDDYIDEIQEDDEEFCFDVGSVETHFDIEKFMEKTKSFENYTSTEYSVRCGRFSQYLLDIEGYSWGVDAKYLYEKFVGNGIKASVIEEPLLIGLRDMKLGFYDRDYCNPFVGCLALEIVYEDDEYKLNDDKEMQLVMQILFSLNSRYTKAISLQKLQDHNPCDDFYDEEVEADCDENDMKTIKIDTLPRYSPILKMYINAKEVKDTSLRFLMFYKILEYISPSIAKKVIYERLNQKLDKLSVCGRDGNYLDSLIDLTRAYDNSLKDGELANLVLDECADLVELQDLIPLSIRKRMNSDSKFGKKERWTYDNLKNVEFQMKSTLANYLYSTRNSIVHAKSNYKATGFECPPQDLSLLNEMLQALCYTIIYWNYRH